MGEQRWFVVNARDVQWFDRGPRGLLGTFEGDGELEFSQVGINLFVLGPGQPMSMYHWEADQEFYGEEYNAAIKERLGSPSSISLYIEASDLAAFQSRLEAAGVRIIDPLADRPWGKRNSPSKITKATG